MKKKFFKYLIYFLCLFSVQSLAAQSKEEKVAAYIEAAIKAMDKGEFDESLEYLEQAKELDPDNIDVLYEMAMANYIKREYKTAEKILKKLTKHDQVYDRVYQMLGNCYDMQGKRPKAIKTYDKGLKKFPNSGILNLERGNMELAAKEYSKALNYYEQGIKGDPSFPSNYYWATKIYLASTEEVWGMVYGEIFLNLERTSKRTAEISQLLYDTYKSEINFKGDSSFSISFSKSTTINLSMDDLLDTTKLKKLMPFGMIYEMKLSTAIVGQKEINLASLNTIRRNFIREYFGDDTYENYPNILFDYQKELVENGHFEAYNYWLLSKGNIKEFNAWQANNKEKWESFFKWYVGKHLETSEGHSFSRFQY